MRNLLPLLLFACTLLLSRQAHAQRPLGKPEAFKGCNSISIATMDDRALATSRLTQLLAADKYQVNTYPVGFLVARRANVGPMNAQIIIWFTLADVAGDPYLFKQTGKGQANTVIFIHGFYKTEGMRAPLRIGNAKSEVLATTWAVEQQLAAAYPDSAAVRLYDVESVTSQSAQKERATLDKW